jgi:hypothetical protein
MRPLRQTSMIGVAALWRARRLRRAAALFGTLGLLVQALITAWHQPAVAASGARFGLALCHVGPTGSAGKPGEGPAKGAPCPICLALAAGGSAVMPDGAALRLPAAAPVRLPRETRLNPLPRFGYSAAQPRGPPPAA